MFKETNEEKLLAEDAMLAAYYTTKVYAATLTRDVAVTKEDCLHNTRAAFGQLGVVLNRSSDDFLEKVNALAEQDRRAREATLRALFRLMDDVSRDYGLPTRVI